MQYNLDLTEAQANDVMAAQVAAAAARLAELRRIEAEEAAAKKPAKGAKPPAKGPHRHPTVVDLTGSMTDTNVAMHRFPHNSVSLP